MQKTFAIYHDYKERSICKKIIEELNSDYSLEQLNKFFKDKVKECFSIAVEADENHDDDVYDELLEDTYNNFLFVLKIEKIVRTLRDFYDRGYNFEVLKMAANDMGIEITLNLTNLTKSQISRIKFFVFEGE